jgi:hypothetical protein
MTLISKIGPLEFSVIACLGALLLYRIQAAPESRVATALVFIFLARFASSFINGFSISDSTEAILGQLDTVFSFIMLGFAFLEVLLLKHVQKWRRPDLWILSGLLGIGFLNLVWKLTLNSQLISNDFLYLLPIVIFLALRPMRSDLKFLPYFGALMILLVFVSAVAGYQNPLHPYRGVDFGLGSQYQNQMWSLFGLEERFRGPYFHPNQLGIQITFLSVLVLMKPTKLYMAILPISFALLLLASSRTSMIALLTGFLLRIYFDITSREQSRSSNLRQVIANVQQRRRFTFKKLFVFSVCLTSVYIVIRVIAQNNATGSGRLQNNRQVISSLGDNLILGQGPVLTSGTITENTILTLLGFFGLTGLSLFLLITFSLMRNFRKSPVKSKQPFLILVVTFSFASAGEALLTGSSMDTGLYYFLALLALTRESSKDPLHS